LDHFKELNDSLGHAAGDTLLQTLAERFRDYFGSQDLTSLGISDSARIGLARLGGDEFAIVIPRVKDSSAAGELAQQLLQLIGKPMTIADRSLTHSASVGIALFPDDAENVESLIQHADAALYAAKSRGRNRHAFYESSFDARAERRHAIEQGLREALARGEFRLHYQPKVDTATEEVVGFEALLRWKSQELGDVGPGEFIPIAEERRMIGTIGAWCLEEACRQIKSWSLEGFEPVPVSVNVSSAQFEETDLQRVVTEALRKHTVDPQLLELELTESLLLEEGEHTALALRDLRSIGVRIALDDFGTGYSALTYLNRFPLDVLKMDRDLLRDIEDNPAAVGIASAVVSMAHSLGLTVVAEGIDSEGQVPVLQRMNCDQIQGFLYAPALPPEDARRFLAPRGGRPPVAEPGGSLPGRVTGSQAAATPQSDLGAEAPASAASSSSVSEPQISESPVVSTTETLQPEGDPTQRTPAENVAVVRADDPSDVGRRVLVLDGGDGLVGPAALRLSRLGVDVHYAVDPDEGLLFVAQETSAIRLLLASPTVDLDKMRTVREAMSREIGALPVLIVIGEEPDAAARARIRDAGATWILWSPFDDTELAFVVKSALALPRELAQRREPRVPVDLVAKVQSGGRREMALLSSLSPRGAFVEMSDPLPVESQLRIEFELPTHRFRLFARVVHTQVEDADQPLTSTSGMGVVFFGPERETELALRKAVEERAARYLP
jgi:diguanylate cyclase (GGDEF)-like protein